MDDDEYPTGIIRMTASAPGYDCDVCGGRTGVCHVAIPECWRHPEDGRWIDLLAWQDCYLCEMCAQPDGGLVSAVRRDGWIVYRLGTQSKLTGYGGRLVCVPFQRTKH